MNTPPSASRTPHRAGRTRRQAGNLRFLTGWRLVLFKARFGLSVLKYVTHRRKYPLFSLRSILPARRGKLLEIRKVAALDGFVFTTTMRVPRWPSTAFDIMAGNGGLAIESITPETKRQIDSVILGITRKCAYDCLHCYDSANRADHDTIPLRQWRETIGQLQRIGTSVIVLSGGEPMLRYPAVLGILEACNPGITDFHLHSSGSGVSYRRARELQSRGLVAAGISIDYPTAERHDRFRRHIGAFEEAVHALHAFREAGIFTYTNTCLQKEMVQSGDLWRLLDFARQHEVGTVQLLEPKPCGAFHTVGLDDLFSEEERRITVEFVTTANRSPEYRDYPPVSYTAYYERPEHLGCLMGGLSHFTIDSVGNVSPCVFVPVSFGNILHEEFTAIYQRMRSAIPRPLHTACPSLLLRRPIAQCRRRQEGFHVTYEAIEEEWKSILSG